jgi:hypothetical protein
MKLIQIMMICTLLPRVAGAMFAERPIEEVVAEAVGIVDATIVSVRTASWQFGEASGVCGFIYEAHVSETFKGPYSGLITFASSAAMAARSRYLLFLKDYEGDFPSDTEILRPAAEEAERQRCLNELPDLKTDWLHAAEFLPYGFVRLSQLTEPSPDLNATFVEVRSAHINGEPVQFHEPSRWDPSAADALLLGYTLGTNVVQWERLRAWLLRNASETANNRFQGDAPQAARP